MTRLAVLTVFVASLAIVSGMAAQTGADDPIEAAARYILEQQRLTDLRAGLVVDTEHQIQGVGLQARRRSGGARASLRNPSTDAPER